MDYFFPSKYHGGTRNLTRLARHWIEQNRQRDFFLWIHFIDPHVPYSPPRHLLPDTPPPQWIGYSFNRSAEIRGGRALSEQERSWIRQLYLAETQFVDQNVGSFLVGEVVPSRALMKDRENVFHKSRDQQCRPLPVDQCGPRFEVAVSGGRRAVESPFRFGHRRKASALPEEGSDVELVATLSKITELHALDPAMLQPSSRLVASFFLKRR